MCSVLLLVMLAAQTPVGEKEAALGRRMAAEVRRTSTPVNLPEVRNYVAQLGARLAKGYSFEVVAMDSNEPVVLPGHYVFVPVSLLIAANDEAEFAATLTRALERGPRRWQGVSPQAAAPTTVSAGEFAGNDRFQTIQAQAIHEKPRTAPPSLSPK